MTYTTKLKVNYVDRETGVVRSLPAVYTESGFVVSHLRYLASHDARSTIWKERSAFSLRLLIDYINAMPFIDNSIKMLRSFSRAILTGTIDYSEMDDPLGLFWEPRKINDANNILHHITSYTDFISQEKGFDDPQINPFRRASSYEERLNWCAYQHKKNNVFLNHLAPVGTELNRLKYVRTVRRHEEIPIVVNDVPRFPEDQVAKLLNDGFVLKSNEPDFKSIAITMLLNFGGLRKSEAFHLYVSDITLHPNRTDEALVRIYHPEFGESPDPQYRDRTAYLKATTGLKPRNLYLTSERLHSGWKGALLTDRKGFFEVVFNPPQMAKEFLNVWVQYLKYQRAEPSQTNYHPFAFTNERGDPETIKQFQVLHSRAVKRIGLVAQKSFGTTEHGHRHAYGYRCRQSGLSQVEVQKAMHHKNINSCLVYIKPTSEEVRTKLREIENKGISRERT